MPMAWHIEGNVAALSSAIEMARQQGATLLVAPELALTGFHRQIAQQCLADALATGLERVRDAVRAAGVALVLGAPTIDAGGGPFNTHLYIDARGEIVGQVSKNGLTASEATFFEQATSRPVVELCGLRCTSVLCREVEDADSVSQQVAASAGADLVFWPSFIGRASAPDDVHVFEPHYQPLASALARRLRAWMVQCNWPQSLNEPGSLRFGESAVFAPDGRVVLRLPVDATGVAVFDLGAQRMQWLPWQDCSALTGT